jgi:hypothetical protein
MLGQFSWKHETNRRLNFSTGKGGFFVVRGKFASFGSDAFKNIVDERVHNGHALFGNSSIRVDLRLESKKGRTIYFVRV